MSEQDTAKKHRWNFCPKCGQGGTNDSACGGNDFCWHCGNCLFVECVDDYVSIEDRPDHIRHQIASLAAELAEFEPVQGGQE